MVGLPTESGARCEVLDGAGVDARVEEMAEGLFRLLADGAGPVALVGIRAGGTPLAERLAGRLAGHLAGLSVPVHRGAVDITLYRDDLYTGLERPVMGDTDLRFDVDGCRVVLVDDVLFTGRTVRAAMDEILDYGRPACIRLAVLVDRGHRELPIAADVTGLRLETALRDRVRVEWGEGRAGGRVTLEQRAGERR